ncbi:hypothetical protein CYMTET_20988 [Cymbomonas tetramitiformis]|uniref:EGF-like domain-containing protein n=1 Tax=Cymbomonas tetramitiformis TaxID=36881 RepID=A0AAE0G3H1_9CHLO|nr:hypothetical protein CYMTET_20988 [Cymbomonas tetramitiformis]
MSSSRAELLHFLQAEDTVEDEYLETPTSSKETEKQSIAQIFSLLCSTLNRWRCRLISSREVELSLSRDAARSELLGFLSGTAGSSAAGDGDVVAQRHRSDSDLPMHLRRVNDGLLWSWLRFGAPTIRLLTTASRRLWKVSLRMALGDRAYQKVEAKVRAMFEFSVQHRRLVRLALYMVIALWLVGTFCLMLAFVALPGDLYTGISLNQMAQAPVAEIRSEHMVCHRNGTCACDNGWQGPTCSEETCWPSCIHGKCLRVPFCTCEEGYRGHQCELAICSEECVHGDCTYPEHCECAAGWYGRRCDLRCSNGRFNFLLQECACDSGWDGAACEEPVCEPPCQTGKCVGPNTCECWVGWSGAVCDTNEVKMHVEELLEGISPRTGLPSIMLHRVSEDAGDANSVERFEQWTRRLPAELRPTLDSFNGSLIPETDIFLPHTTQRFSTCVAVGNSAGLLLGEARVASVINEHEVVLRFNNAPTHQYADAVGKKTTFQLLNRAAVEKMLTGRPASRRRATDDQVIWLLWRAEDFAVYPLLRERHPEQNIILLAPEFLLPTVALYKVVMERLKAHKLIGEGAQEAPHGFLGIAFLLQVHVCSRVYTAPASRQRAPCRIINFY